MPKKIELLSILFIKRGNGLIAVAIYAVVEQHFIGTFQSILLARGSGTGILMAYKSYLTISHMYHINVGTHCTYISVTELKLSYRLKHLRIRYPL